jgi:hypothetical protein
MAVAALAQLAAAALTVRVPVVLEESGASLTLQYTEGQDMLAVVTAFSRQVCGWHQWPQWVAGPVLAMPCVPSPRPAPRFAVEGLLRWFVRKARACAVVGMGVGSPAVRCMGRPAVLTSERSVVASAHGDVADACRLPAVVAPPCVPRTRRRCSGRAVAAAAALGALPRDGRGKPLCLLWLGLGARWPAGGHPLGAAAQPAALLHARGWIVPCCRGVAARGLVGASG